MPTPRLLFALLLLLPALTRAVASPNVRVNSVGFVPDYAKKATVLGAASNASFTVKRVSDNSVAFSGNLSANAYSSETNETLTAATFSGLTEAGSFYLDVTGVGTSVTFTVSSTAFNNSLWLNVMGFYNQRCGTATNMSYNGSTWGHAACHMGDGDTFYYNGSSAIRDARGGWHDAGDFNKYINNAAATVGPMLHAWERHRDRLEQLSLPYASDPAVPDYLEELKWELDWVKKMQFSDGRVSDKITVWGGFEPFVMPDQHFDQRYYTTWGTGEIANATAMLALGARVFAPYAPSYAAGLLSAATVSFNYLVANPGNLRANITGTPQGNYTTTSDQHYRLWAYVEYFETTGDLTALALAEAAIVALGGDKSDSNFDWADLSNLGVYTYALSTRSGRNSTYVSQCRSSITSDATGIRNAANAHPYGRGLGGYWWGANGTVVRQAYTLDAGYLINGDTTYLDTLQDQLSWVYGRNFYNRSFVTGEGLNPPLFPHDRESAADGVAAPKPGHLVGGSDGCPGQGGCAPGILSATKWEDDQSRANLNEIAINWDGAMTYALAVLAGYPLGTPTPTPSFTASPTPSPTPSATPSFTHSPTASPSSTITPDWTHTATPTLSPTPSVTATFTYSPTPTASPTNGLTERPGILRWQAVPQPSTGPTLKLAVQLNGGADSLELRLYTSNYVRALTAKAQNPPFGTGWNRAFFDISSLPPGVYFGVLWASTGQGPQDRAVPQRVILLP